MATEKELAENCTENANGILASIENEPPIRCAEEYSDALALRDEALFFAGELIQKGDLYAEARTTVSKCVALISARMVAYQDADPHKIFNDHAARLALVKS